MEQVINKRSAQTKKYGIDRPIYRLSMVALLEEHNIDPKYADLIRSFVDSWRQSIDYYDYNTSNLERGLLSIEQSDNMKNLCRAISVHAYHREESNAGLL